MGPPSPEQCPTLFAAHLNSGNLDGLMALYEPGASLVQQNGPPARGTAAIRQRLAAFIALQPHYATQTAKVIPADENLVVLYTDWSIATEGPDGKPMTLAGKALHIVRRQPDGTWKIVVDDPFGRN